MHQPRNAAARARPERERLGVFEMVGDFVEERVEQLFDRAPAIHAIVRVDPAQVAAIGSSPPARAGSAVN